VSSWELSSGMSCSAIYTNVSIMFAVFEPSGFFSVVSGTVFLVVPQASLYIAFHGFFEDVVLQYCFHELIFSFLIAAWYFLYPSKC